MKKNIIAIFATLITAAALFFFGAFAVNTVIASEGKAEAAGGASGTQLRALSGVEIIKAYKKEKYGDVGCTVVLPDGYVPSEEVKGMYISERSPLDSSNIYYTASEDVDTGELDRLLGSDGYKERMEESLKDAYGSQAAVEDFQCTPMEIDGCPAYKIELSCRMEEAEMEQLIYVILADKAYTVTYSQSVDDERMEEFEKSAETIRVVKKGL